MARPSKFRAIVVIPGQYLGDVCDLEKLRGKPVWMLLGSQDDPGRWLEPTRMTAEALKKGGARVELEVLEGQGHVPAVAASRLYDWIDRFR
ncbi:hypothetical protein DYH09_33175 [bacterium CPR1]|nr:hypothetical protein [bacterium CPR1]